MTGEGGAFWHGEKREQADGDEWDGIIQMEEVERRQSDLLLSVWMGNIHDVGMPSEEW